MSRCADCVHWRARSPDDNADVWGWCSEIEVSLEETGDAYLLPSLSMPVRNPPLTLFDWSCKWHDPRHDREGET